MQRRAFLKGLAGTAVVSLVSREVVQSLTSADAAAPDSPIPAGNPVPQTFQIPNGPGGPSAALQRLTISSDGKTPTVKNFSPEWVAALTQRGAPKVYTAANSADFAYLGMPVGGIGTGQVYFGGDGKLWWWDIFNNRASVWPNDSFNAYVHPYHVNDSQDAHQYVLAQGFGLRVTSAGTTITKALDKSGFSDVRFLGQYPIGTVDYKDSEVPVGVRLEAFSPFIPLDADDSTLPATVMQFTVTNHGPHTVTGEVAGWLQNAICISSAQRLPGTRSNRALREPGAAWVEFSAAGVIPTPGQAVANPQPPTTFEDWSSGTYADWTATGTAFGTHPAQKGEIYHSQAVQNEQGRFMADSFLGGKDDATGTLTSKPFTITRPYVNVLVGGGDHPGTACVNLRVGGKVVRTATGSDTETLGWATWAVAALQGEQAQIEIVDNEGGGRGHIMVDAIEFADTAHAAAGGSGELKSQQDFGTMALAALGTGASASASLAGAALPGAALDAPHAPKASQDFAASTDAPLAGAVSLPFSLKAGQSATLTFLVTWHFPNPLTLGLKTDMRREYATRFPSASAVVDYVRQHLGRLAAQTRLWRDTWYDSTLPHWFLDRTFANLSILATSTSYRLGDKRFYGYEGMYSCPGTCTHVWGYVQALGHLFPEMHQAMLQQDHLMPGIGIRDDGGVPARSEIGDDVAVDGQSDVVLRSYLAHQHSPDMAFLRRNYFNIRKALQFLLDTNDPQATGTLIGYQHNTLDATYYTRGAWLSLNYQAALRAMAAMSEEMGDAADAAMLRQTADRGRDYVQTHLFNGEYFFQEKDPKYPNSTGTYNGCEYSQLVGHNWTHQVGLGGVVDSDKAITALNSLWRYSYTTDVGPYTAKFGTGRPFVLPGEGGLIGCTWPYGYQDVNVGYLSECQSGYEYACSAAMMWEGLVDKALAHIRTVHDRYDGAKRNPWNEVEAGSHYSRSMAAYGLYTAVCGYEYHGPRGHLAFIPRLTPENFRAPFTTAEGWGTFAQKRAGGTQTETLKVVHGKLRLKTLAFAVPHGTTLTSVKVLNAGAPVRARLNVAQSRVTITLAGPVSLAAGQELQVLIA